MCRRIQSPKVAVLPGTRGSAAREGNWRVGVGLREVELELEGIVFPDVRRVAAVLKAVEEETKATANDQLGIDLIGETETRRKVGFLRVPEARSVLVGDVERDAVVGKQSGEAGDGIGGKIARVRPRRNDVQGRTRRRGAGGNEVGLVVMVLVDQAKEVVTHAEVDGQLASDLPVVVEITAVVVLTVVGFGDVGGSNIGRTSEEINPANGR